MWRPVSQSIKYDLVQGNKQVVNHYEFHREISTKDKLLLNLQAYCLENKLNLYDIIPPTFLLDFGSEDIEKDISTFLRYFN